MDMTLDRAEPGQTCSICGETPAPECPRLMNVRGKTGFHALFCSTCSFEFFLVMGVAVQNAKDLMDSAEEEVVH